MSFKITIEETKDVVKTVGKNWEVIDYEDKCINLAIADSKDRCKPIMGYTPEVQKIVPETKTIFEAQTDDLDIIRVIQAVYKMN